MASGSPPQADSGAGFLLGKLLIALPGMSDPRFEKSVIYMCAHSQDGAMGLIVNKPFDGLTFRELMVTLEIAMPDTIAPPPVLFGGPVRTGQGFVLHSTEYDGDGTLDVSPGIAMTATVDILRAIASGDGPKKALFTLGYAGWGPGQIEDEILANGWLHCDAVPSILFDLDCDAKWRAALATLGADISGLSAEAGRA